jgi:5-methylcytosine-specific restriction protein B
MKKLYEDLIEKEPEIHRWCKNYQKFYETVERRRERIKSGEGLSQNDEIFLNQLLYEKSNGIAHRGRSVLKKETFQDFIRDKDFISALEQFILTPDIEDYIRFRDTWFAKSETKHHLRINRVAAACTLKVSTTVDEEKFDQVFKWLEGEKIIPVYDGEKNWFSKNIFLMDEIKDKFSVELQNKETDAFYLSKFVWLLYKNLPPDLLYK